MWIYNPPEPLGNPTAPGPDQTYEGLLGRGGDFWTQGRCGACGACPKMWRMVVPELDNPYANDYAGVVYLQRMPYRYISVPDAEFGDYFMDKCSWAQYLAPRFPDANTYLGPFGDPQGHGTVGDIGSGWHLTFDQFGWGLYSPIESGTIEFNPDAQSRWRISPEYSFRCVGVNVFRLPEAVTEFRFPYEPATLTLTPFYG